MIKNSIDRDIDWTIQSRKNFLRLIDACEPADLTRIPEGFNNHLLWNFGHVITTQQLLCYRLSGLDTHLPEEIIDRYRKGSKPTNGSHAEDMEPLRAACMDLLERMRKDYNTNAFKDYNTYETSYGLTLENIEDAIRFNAMHEAMHLGYFMALKRAL